MFGNKSDSVQIALLFFFNYITKNILELALGNTMNYYT